LPHDPTPRILVVVATLQTLAAPKPLLRGVLHQGAFLVALVVGPLLVVGANDPRRQVAAAVFACSVAACFGASALYHRVTWTARVRPWMRRVDHAGIYLLIAGSYAPFGLLVLSPGWAVVVLAIVWSGALIAIVMKLCWLSAPKWLSAVNGLVLGWVGAVAFGQLLKLPTPALALIAVSGVLYTAGAVIYASTRYGYPLSTTHVVSGAVMGAGATKRFSAVRWGVAGNIMIAWLLTLPAAALAAAGMWFLVDVVF
jgi:hemolysin III